MAVSLAPRSPCGPAYAAGYARARCEAGDWPHSRIMSCLRRRMEVLETACRFDGDRLEWLDEAAGVVDALTDRIAELEGAQI
jgi:hypothetical protein